MPMQSYQAMTWREKSSSTLAWSRIYAAPISRLGCLAIECQGVFPSEY